MTRLGTLALTAGLLCCATAGAGALDECTPRGSQGEISRCLVDLDAQTQAALRTAEGAAGTRARDLDAATGRPGAVPALAKSMRAFTEYRERQCEFVKAMYASGAGAEQAKLGCRVDLTRRRVRELQS